MHSCFNQQVCADVTPEQEAGWVSWLVQAAELGDVEARSTFASGRFIQGTDLDALQFVPLYRAKRVELGAAGS